MNTSPWAVLWLAAGFALWLIAFGALYGLQGLGCAYAWPEAVHRGLLIAGFAIVVLLHAGLLFIGRGQSESGTAGFLLQAGWLASLAALVAAVLTYAPVLFATLCL